MENNRHNTPDLRLAAEWTDAKAWLKETERSVNANRTLVRRCEADLHHARDLTIFLAGERAVAAHLEGEARRALLISINSRDTGGDGEVNAKADGGDGEVNAKADGGDGEAYGGTPPQD